MLIAIVVIIFFIIAYLLWCWRPKAPRRPSILEGFSVGGDLAHRAKKEKKSSKKREYLDKKQDEYPDKSKSTSVDAKKKSERLTILSMEAGGSAANLAQFIEEIRPSIVILRNFGQDPEFHLENHYIYQAANGGDETYILVGISKDIRHKTAIFRDAIDDIRRSSIVIDIGAVIAAVNVEYTSVTESRPDLIIHESGHISNGQKIKVTGKSEQYFENQKATVYQLKSDVVNSN